MSKLYKFSELSDKAKRKALDDNISWNVDYDWWDYVYEDAERIGLKITGFDLDRGRTIDSHLNETVYKCCELILDQHGPNCDTSKIAAVFMPLCEGERCAYICENGLESGGWYEESEELVKDFHEQLDGVYLQMLQEEYDWKLSDAAIEESFEANDVRFYQDGRIRLQSKAISPRKGDRNQ